MTLSTDACERTDADPAPEIERLALRLLAMREHSRLELMRKIRARGFLADDAEGVLDRLERQGALDESRLAERYVAERAEKGFGPNRIRAELREKGVAEALVERQLSLMDDAWPDCLARAHERRFRAGLPTDRSEYAKQARFLEQRGFSADAIRRFLRFHD